MVFCRCSHSVFVISAFLIGGGTAEDDTGRCSTGAVPCLEGDSEDAALLQMPAQERGVTLETSAPATVSLHHWNLGHPEVGDEALFNSALEYIASQIKSKTVDFFHVINFSPTFSFASLGSYGEIKKCCDDGCSMILYNTSRWTNISVSTLCLTSDHKVPATMAMFETAGSASLGQSLTVVGTHLPWDPPLYPSWYEAVSSLKGAIGEFRVLQPWGEPIALLADTNAETTSNGDIFGRLGLEEGAKTSTEETTCCYDSLFHHVGFKPDRIIASFSPGFDHPVTVGTPTKWFKNMHNPIDVTIPLASLGGR